MNDTLGRYKIIGELGRGAMGAVYRALDPLIEREVAIKTLLPNLPEDVMAEVRGRFLREARSAGRINHPNIVTIFDVGEQDGMAYIAMELLEGRSLQSILRDSGRLAYDLVADIAAQVADALDFAQRYSIVHRDVKPANVMIDSMERAKLMDFGVAYVPSSTMTQTGTALGSPRYMSPEQVLGMPVDPRSDIFSLGVVLYEMLARRTPFENPGDTTVFALMNRIAGTPHPPLRQVDARVPPAFERIVDRALAKKPEERYQRAGEMAADLRRLGTAPARAADDHEKTVAMRSHPAARPIEEDKVRSQLLHDLDKFVEQFDREEQARINAEEQAQLRKEAEMRRWSEEQARKREVFERSLGPTPVAELSNTGTMRRAALDMLRKQGAAQPPKVDPSIARDKRIAELDHAMRNAFQYLAELVRELNEVHPTSEQPYEFIYLGKLPSVMLSDAFVDNRMRHLHGKEVCEHMFMRLRIKPKVPAKVKLLGEDIPRCEQYLKAMKIEFTQRAEAKSDFGKVTRSEFTVSGSLPCEIALRADYDAGMVNLELTNVRRLGRVQYRLATAIFSDIIDDLARYMLGVDDAFEGLARR
ncbi:MAG: protein kinase domain-containing protein [Burkholderiales bacterium]